MHGLKLEKIKGQKTMGNFEGHTEKRGWTLAVTGQVTHYSLNEKDSEKNIHQDEKEIIDPDPFEAGPIETLNEKDQEALKDS